MINKIRIWLEAVRAPFFTATIVPILLGVVIAWHQTGNFNLKLFLFTLTGGLFIHAGLDLINDYFDHISGNDEGNKFPTPFSGGSRMIQKNILSPKQVLRGSIICFSTGSLIGLYLNFILSGNIILIIGMIGVFIAFFYSATPVQIGHTGFGELSCAIGFGPLIVIGAYYVQTQQLSWLPLFASVPVAVLIMMVLYINEFPDYEADKRVSKMTLVVILGKKKAIKIYYLFLGFVYLWVIFGIIIKIFPYFAFIIFITLPLCIKAVKVARSNYDKIHELLPANAATIGLHLVFGLLLSISYILDELIK